nr:uncharacterized protein LOC111833326 [Paramormyrops kingsleyae]
MRSPLPNPARWHYCVSVCPGRHVGPSVTDKTGSWWRGGWGELGGTVPPHHELMEAPPLKPARDPTKKKICLNQPDGMTSHSCNPVPVVQSRNTPRCTVIVLGSELQGHPAGWVMFLRLLELRNPCCPFCLLEKKRHVCPAAVHLLRACIYEAHLPVTALGTSLSHVLHRLTVTLLPPGDQDGDGHSDPSEVIVFFFPLHFPFISVFC